MTDYWQRKLAGLCVRNGCHAKTQDDHLLCTEHAIDSRRRTKKAMRAIRAKRRAQLMFTIRL